MIKISYLFLLYVDFKANLQHIWKDYWYPQLFLKLRFHFFLNFVVILLSCHHFLSFSLIRSILSFLSTFRYSLRVPYLLLRKVLWSIVFFLAIEFNDLYFIEELWQPQGWIDVFVNGFMDDQYENPRDINGKLEYFLSGKKD
jgi:hypothetical protein